MKLNNYGQTTITHNRKEYRIEKRPELMYDRTVVRVFDGEHFTTHVVENNDYMNLYSDYEYINRHEHQLKALDDYFHPGPTNRELRDPRIRYAWEELQLLRKLIGAGYDTTRTY